MYKCPITITFEETAAQISEKLTIAFYLQQI